MIQVGSPAIAHLEKTTFILTTIYHSFIGGLPVGNPRRFLWEEAWTSPPCPSIPKSVQICCHSMRYPREQTGESWARIFKCFKEPRNRFLGSLSLSKFGLWSLLCCEFNFQRQNWYFWTGLGGKIDSWNKVGIKYGFSSAMSQKMSIFWKQESTLKPLPTAAILFASWKCVDQKRCPSPTNNIWRRQFWKFHIPTLHMESMSQIIISTIDFSQGIYSTESMYRFFF